MESIDGFLCSVGHTLWGVSWQIAILCGFIFLISFVCRKASAGFRYWLWCILLFRLCIPVELAIPVGFQNEIQKAVTSLPRYLIEETAPFNLFSRFMAGTAFLPASHEQVKRDVTSGQEGKAAVVQQYLLTRILPLSPAIPVLWFGVVLFIGILVMWHAVRNRNLFKGCPVVERPDLKALLSKLCGRLTIRRPVELRSSDRDSVLEPSVLGVFHPSICLSRRMIETWGLEDIEPVLMHELAHVKRRDNLVNWLQIIAQVLYFFHPLVWYANWKIRQLREDACDDIALEGTRAERVRYTEKMLRIIKESDGNPSPSFLLIGFADARKSLAKRILRILRSKCPNRPGLTRFSIISLGLIALMGIVLSSGRSENASTSVLKNSVMRHSNANHSNSLALEGDYRKGNERLGRMIAGAGESDGKARKTIPTAKKVRSSNAMTIASGKNDNLKIDGGGRPVQPAAPAMPILEETERIAEDSKIKSTDFAAAGKGSLDIPSPSGIGTGKGTGSETGSGNGGRAGNAEDGISVEPRLIKGVFPIIPERLRGKTIQGETELKVKIDEVGKVIDVRIVSNTTNSEEIAQAAAEAAFKCVYVPAMSGKKANVAWTIWRLRFNYRG